ncbi:MAG: hypothetical protein FWB76_06595 [Oscillospiraceae bacterium]|nr:hypothetical protein [Oscillospiraceae bacterium]
MFCTNCGKQIEPEHKFCFCCGAARYVERPQGTLLPQHTPMPPIVMLPFFLPSGRGGQGGGYYGGGYYGGGC